LDSLGDVQVAEYFSRSFRVVDGLWFMKVEDQFGFDVALRVDAEVWRVMPKIQARMIKSFLKLGKGEDALLESLKAKLSMEGFKFKVEQDANEFRIRITDCPWHNLMVKSGREKFSAKVGETICNAEYSVWASEFDENTQFTLAAQICKGSKHCLLTFKRHCGAVSDLKKE
jgi:predicted ArsR family transcriptional regulator